jgi:Domain of unknown function (DUF5668)
MRRHRLDLLSLFFGLCFVGIGAVFIAGRVDVTDIDWDVTWPLPLIAGGFLMLAAALRRVSTGRSEAAVSPPVAEEEPDADPEDAEDVEDAEANEENDSFRG